MDCLRSFNLNLGLQSNMTAANGFETYTIGGQNFWLFNSTALDSIFNIEGFKNINIYQITLSGDVNGDIVPAGFKCIVQNFSIILEISGQNSIIGGFVDVVPNGFGMFTQSTNAIFNFSKYLPTTTFETPIQSAKKITVKSLFADGIANQSLISAQIGLLLTITVFYKFEGE